MNALLNAHVGGRLVAIISGAIAIAARTNGSLHAVAGTWFFGSTLVFGVTASILARCGRRDPSAVRVVTGHRNGSS